VPTSLNREDVSEPSGEIEMTAATPAPAPVVPGKTLGIVAVIVVFFISLLGLILGIVARS
jgi:hypothetical protein